MDFLSKKKTLLFLLMCLSVHAVYAVVFGVLGIFPLLILNIFSTVFYIMVLLLFKRNQDFYIGFTYFEIITFSLLNISQTAFLKHKQAKAELRHQFARTCLAQYGQYGVRPSHPVNLMHTLLGRKVTKIYPNRRIFYIKVR